MGQHTRVILRDPTMRQVVVLQYKGLFPHEIEDVIVRSKRRRLVDVVQSLIERAETTGHPSACEPDVTVRVTWSDGVVRWKTYPLHEWKTVHGVAPLDREAT